MKCQLSASTQKIHFKDGILIMEDCEDSCQFVGQMTLMLMGFAKRKKLDKEEAIERTLSKLVESAFNVLVIIVIINKLKF